MLKFIKNNSVATLYLILFVITQLLASFLIMMHKIITDMDFADKVYTLLSPCYTEDFVIIPSKYSDAMLTMMELMTDTLVPTLLLSNLMVIVIIKLITLGKNHTKFNTKTLSGTSALSYVALGLVLNLVISSVIYLLPESLVESHNMSIDYLLSSNPIVVLLSAGVLAPVAEELVFRFGMLQCLRKIHPIYAVTIQALLFGLLHGNPVQMCYAFILGLIFGFIVLRTDNINTSIIMHIAINTSSALTVLTGVHEFILLPILLLIVGGLLLLKTGSFYEAYFKWRY